MGGEGIAEARDGQRPEWAEGAGVDTRAASCRATKRNAASSGRDVTALATNERKGTPMTDLEEIPDGEPCPECAGVGAVARHYGDETYAEPCMSCGGSGRVILQGDGSRDLRLVPEVERDERDTFGDEAAA